MKRRYQAFMTNAVTVLALVLIAPTASAQDADADGFRPLFNGTNLDGWEQHGGVAEYTVEDGCIVGTSVPRTPNSFLCTKQEFGNFILELEYKVDPLLNSGVQIRSQIVPEDGVIMVNGNEMKRRPDAVYGYQVEIDPSDRAWSAGIYDESRRGWLYNLKNNDAARKAFRQNEWNHYRIVCIGNSIQTWINGVPAANLKDGMTPKGIIGLQVHGVGDAENKIGKQVRWRNVRIKEFSDEKIRVFIGTYTRGDSQGIYSAVLDLTDGSLSEPQLVAEANNPSFVAVHPNFNRLYAVSEISEMDGQRTGGVTAYAIDDEEGSLTQLNTVASEGRGPCHLIVDPTGRNVLVANYGGGSIACLPIVESGELKEASTAIQHEGSSVNPRRQQAPHAHSINVDPNNRFAFVADLGTDKVMIYRFDPESGKLEANEVASASVPPGGGPRHFAFHPSTRFAYTNNEMLSSVTAMKFDYGKGSLEPFQTISTLPEGGHEGNSTAEILVHPSGNFLYCSNRGHDSIAVFAIDPNDGSLTRVENESTQGRTPRNFAIDPSGRYLLAENQASDSIVVLAIDQDTGALEPTGHKIEVPSPVCVRFLPIGD